MPEPNHASTAASPEPSNPLLRPEPGLAIWTVITFVLLLIILKKLAWGPMLANIDQREKAIAQSLLEAERARAAAASSIEEQNRLLLEARREAQDLINRARGEADRAKEDMVARARAEADRLVAAGKQAIDQEKRAALQEIRRTSVDLALAASAKLLRSSIDEAKSRELVSGYIRELETRGEGNPGGAA